ncbi:hypothetical protein HF263_03085 [Rhizobium leguminosarum]|uniref:hypothetical protein n=1 Tax=Rhizobium leguminosarum TaxID=384 RepID=UPI001C9163E4|nr:hypothetical protein [Rhizobium leguminosarum]MBY3055063.1 hypothetical protein [Rhizobium leguminosarum]
MKEIVGACLSQFHNDADSFELLLAFADGRELGFLVSRRAAQKIAAALAGEIASAATSAPVDDYSRGMRDALKYLDDARRSAQPNMSKVLDGAIEHLRRQVRQQGSTEA